MLTPKKNGTSHEMKQPDIVDSFVGAKVRFRRRSIGMSQSQLAERIGVTFQQVQKYEKGTNRIGAGRLFKIAQELEVPLQFFYDGIKTLEKAQHEVTPDDILDAHGDLIAFMATSEAMELCRIYLSIPNDYSRKALIRLAKSLSSDETEAEG